jgi:hypothetical protein
VRKETTPGFSIAPAVAAVKMALPPISPPGETFLSGKPGNRMTTTALHEELRAIEKRRKAQVLAAVEKPVR